MSSRNSGRNASSLELGHHQTITVAGRDAQAWIPAPLTHRDLTLTEPTARLTERAAVRLEHTNPDDLINLLHLIEADTSSQIEGIHGSIVDAAAALHEPDARLPRPSLRLLGALRAVTNAAASTETPTADALLRWHRTLMSDAPTLRPEQIGAWRTQQVWVGGTHPSTAAHVPPPPSHIPDLIEDLINFCATTTLDPVTTAAVAHAQFETIHPFADGNGRVGRALITRLLAAKFGWAPAWSAPVSKNRHAYYAALDSYRDGRAERFVHWFADRLLHAINDTDSLRSLLATRPTPDGRAAAQAYTAFAGQIVRSSADVAVVTGNGERAARAALHQLEDLELVRWHEGFPTGRGGRPKDRWVDVLTDEAVRSVMSQ